jgi:peptidoglycan hydrolase-like protein with peptidoglycan-binding domain
LDIVSTGVFDEKTEQYTKEWQAKNGLAADGVVGPATWTKGLNSL